MNHDTIMQISKLQMEVLRHDHEYLHESHKVLAYLAFPLLEGILRKLCNPFVSLEGRVLKDFTVREGERTYRVGQRCNSLRDILWLAHNELHFPELQSDLAQLRTHITNVADTVDDPYDIIYNWRNSSLHGETSYPTIGGTLLNTALVFLLNAYQQEYDAERADILESVRADQKSAAEFNIPLFSRNFYPPT